VSVCWGLFLQIPKIGLFLRLVLGMHSYNIYPLYNQFSNLLSKPLRISVTTGRSIILSSGCGGFPDLLVDSFLFTFGILGISSLAILPVE